MLGEAAPIAVDDAPLSPLRFLARSAEVWAARAAVVDGERSWTYAAHAERVGRLAGALRSQLGVAAGDRVAVLVPNVAAMLELHYAVPGAGAVLVPLNTRLAAADYAYILEHSGATVLVASEALQEPVERALALLAGGTGTGGTGGTGGAGGVGPRAVVWVDPNGGACDYESLIAAAAPAELAVPADERALLSINYTSGTTGRPKGVMTSHRGAYLHSLGVIAEAGLEPRSAYLWTLPMFHCNGWAYHVGGDRDGRPARVPAGGRARTRSGRRSVRRGVTHMCAAPTVVTMLLGAPARGAVPGARSAVHRRRATVAGAARARRRSCGSRSRTCTG